MTIDVVSVKPKQKIHPHKFTMWIAIGSIVMMFAGLTSAYIVKSGQANWQNIKTPQVFWYSTSVILLSSLTVQMALRSFKQREMNRYRLLIGVTLVLGIAFVILQWLGFQALWEQHITFTGGGAGEVLYRLFGFHGRVVVGRG